MEYSSAQMSCVLKVNIQCEACKAKVMEVLQRIHGVYNITIDGEEGMVKVTGRVNPYTLLGVLEKYGKHAQVKYVKFEGEVVDRNSNYYGEYGYNSYDGMEYCSYQGYYNPYSPHFSQPPIPPPPVPYQFPPPPPSGPFWAPTHPQPPAPPQVYGYGPPPSMPNLPPQHVPPKETSSSQNKCAMM